MILAATKLLSIMRYATQKSHLKSYKRIVKIDIFFLLLVHSLTYQILSENFVLNLTCLRFFLIPLDDMCWCEKVLILRLKWTRMDRERGARI